MIPFPDVAPPTLDRAGITSLPAITPSEAQSISESWLASIAAACSNADTQKVLDLLHPSTPFWRDMLSLTWDFRTLSSQSTIAAFLNTRLPVAQLANFTLNKTFSELQAPFPDLVWLSLVFTFQTKTGNCTGITRLVPLPKQQPVNGPSVVQSLDELEWKAHVVFTNLDSLIGFPEKIGALRNFDSSYADWFTARKAAAEFAGAEEDETKGPTVLLVGGGQSGLGIAARLKALDVPALVIEKNDRVGDNWRKRYDALSLHDPVWYDHMPYLPFPPTWPVYSPAKKLADWLEHYVDALDLNVWTSSSITSLTQDPQSNKWHATILRSQSVAGQVVQQERKLVVKHVIFCTGFGGPNAVAPSYPGADTFKGEIIHSSGFKRAADYQGKKVVVVGACTSGHDIAKDCYEHGIDVTMFQRSSTYITSVPSVREVLLKALYSEGSPPNDIADRLVASYPIFSNQELNRRVSRLLADLDKDIIGPLHSVGFRTNLGLADTGLFSLVLDKCGGYYLDTGASKLVSEGKIKLKNDSQISHFTPQSIVFQDGSSLEADLVVFAVGYGNANEHVSSALSLSNDPANAALIAKIKPVWGVNAEGELKGLYTHHALGVPGLWYMLGNLAMCRFHSSHVALQIKAMEVGVWDGIYQG